MNTKAWVTFSWVSFALICLISAYVVFNFIENPLIRILVGVLYVALIQSTFNLSKVIRDESERKQKN